MERQQIMQVINTMNISERRRALRGMRQAMLLGQLWDGVASTLRRTLRSVARATTVDRAGR